MQCACVRSCTARLTDDLRAADTVSMADSGELRRGYEHALALIDRVRALLVRGGGGGGGGVPQRCALTYDRVP